MRIWLFREEDTVTNAVRPIDISIAHRARADALIYILRILVLKGLKSQTSFLSFILLINPHIYFYK